MLKINKFKGLVAAPFTPMDTKGNLNTGLVPGNLQLLLQLRSIINLSIIRLWLNLLGWLANRCLICLSTFIIFRSSPE